MARCETDKKNDWKENIGTAKMGNKEKTFTEIGERNRELKVGEKIRKTLNWKCWKRKRKNKPMPKLMKKEKKERKKRKKNE